MDGGRLGDDIYVRAIFFFPLAVRLTGIDDTIARSTGSAIVGRAAQIGAYRCGVHALGHVRGAAIGAAEAAVGLANAQLADWFHVLLFGGEEAVSAGAIHLKW